MNRALLAVAFTARLTIRFRGDTTGKTVRLDFTNPVLRRVKFTRLSDVISGR